MSPPSLRKQIYQAYAARNYTLVRSLIRQLLISPAANTIDVPTLCYIHRMLRNVGSPGLIDTLLTVCLGRQDVTSKLLASDIARADSMFIDAVQVLNSYSFAGSPALEKRALLRKVALYPHAWQGGYRDGLAALDSLRQIAVNDTGLFPLYELYPIIYSGLLPIGNNGIPKRAAATRLMERILPSSVEIWQNYPNPFSTVTSFTFKLPEDMQVQLKIYNTLGREIATVSDRYYTRGVHSEVFHAGDLPSGIYFYKLIARKEIVQRKMLLMK